MRASNLIAAVFVGTAFAASPGLAADPVTIGFLPKLDTDPYFQVAKAGAEEAQKEIGGKVVQEAPSQATAEAQIQFIKALVHNLRSGGSGGPPGGFRRAFERRACRERSCG